METNSTAGVRAASITANDSDGRRRYGQISVGGNPGFLQAHGSGSQQHCVFGNSQQVTHPANVVLGGAALTAGQNPIQNGLKQEPSAVPKNTWPATQDKFTDFLPETNQDLRRARVEGRASKLVDLLFPQAPPPILTPNEPSEPSEPNDLKPLFTLRSGSSFYPLANTVEYDPKTQTLSLSLNKVAITKRMAKNGHAPKRTPVETMEVQTIDIIVPDELEINFQTPEFNKNPLGRIFSLLSWRPEFQLCTEKMTIDIHAATFPIAEDKSIACEEEQLLLWPWPSRTNTFNLSLNLHQNAPFADSPEITEQLTGLLKALCAIKPRETQHLGNPPGN
ncbi:MAG: hypothetical protein V4623_10980 [Pseudomonadota bacterium]